MIPLDVRQQDVVAALDREAICIWFAFGFMLNEDTFFKGIKWKRPLIPAWRYEPKEISFEESVNRFADVFETVVAERVKGAKVMLPLSGGLDSRTLAAALQRLGVDAYSYSYKFQNSFNETKYGKELAKIAGWQFDEYIVPKGYLWDKIEELAGINQCYTEFTHPRQMAVVKNIASKGDLFLLGHWGDVLFDDMGLHESISEEQLLNIVLKKMLKKGGLEIASDLWTAWGLQGNFKEYLKQRLENLLADIKIDNVNAKVRAFKSLYWATRWTNANLQVFSHYKPITVPYYDERIGKLVCETPEEHIKGRRIQIEYLKRFAPAMAKVSWQDKEPYNLFNYGNHLSWKHMPWRITNKAKRITTEKLMGKKHVIRNWEIQFEGDENDKQLQSYLFENADFKNEIPEEIIHKYYNNFKTKDAVYNSHPVSMLLTFSAFVKRQNKLRQLA